MEDLPDAEGPVAALPEVLRQRRHPRVARGLAEVVLVVVDAGGGRPAPGQDGGPAGPAQGRGRVGPLEDGAVGRQRVQVRSADGILGQWRRVGRLESA